MEIAKVNTEEIINWDEFFADVKYIFDESDTDGKKLIRLCILDLFEYKKLTTEENIEAVSEKITKCKELMLLHSKMLTQHFN